MIGPSLDLCDYALKSLIIDLNSIQTLNSNPLNQIATANGLYIQDMCSNIVLSLAPMSENIHDRICDMSSKYKIEMNEEFESAIHNYLTEVKHLV